MRFKHRRSSSSLTRGLNIAVYILAGIIQHHFNDGYWDPNTFHDPPSPQPTPVPTRPATPEPTVNIVLPGDLPLLESLFAEVPNVIPLSRRIERLLAQRLDNRFTYRRLHLVRLVRELKALIDPENRTPTLHFRLEVPYIIRYHRRQAGVLN